MGMQGIVTPQGRAGFEVREGAGVWVVMGMDLPGDLDVELDYVSHRLVYFYAVITVGYVFSFGGCS